MVYFKILPIYRLLEKKFSDDSAFRLHGEDNIAIKRYVISFWNGVDLRYKLLQGPSVKISIAGIIISRVCTSLLLTLHSPIIPKLSHPDLFFLSS